MRKTKKRENWLSLNAVSKRKERERDKSKKKISAHRV
jgi:hypothetical protein